MEKLQNGQMIEWEDLGQAALLRNWPKFVHVRSWIHLPIQSN